MGMQIIHDPTFYIWDLSHFVLNLGCTWIFKVCAFKQRCTSTIHMVHQCRLDGDADGAESGIVLYAIS